jgi:hypothetical protein
MGRDEGVFGSLCNPGRAVGADNLSLQTLLVCHASEVKNVLFQICKDREQIVTVEPVVETSDRGLRKLTG